MTVFAGKLLSIMKQSQLWNLHEMAKFTTKISSLSDAHVFCFVLKFFFLFFNVDHF